MRAHWHLWILALPVVMTPGCTATKSAADLEVVQNTRGFLTKSLYYAGSSRGHHYFEQWDPVSVKNLLVPSGITFMGKDLKNPWQSYRVARSGVTLARTMSAAGRCESGKLRQMPPVTPPTSGKTDGSELKRSTDRLTHRSCACNRAKMEAWSWYMTKPCDNARDTLPGSDALRVLPSDFLFLILNFRICLVPAGFIVR